MDRKKIKDYEEFKTDGFRFVVTHSNRIYPDRANFLGTGKALVGMLKQYETLEHFIEKRLPKIKKNAEKRAISTMVDLQDLLRKMKYKQK